MSRPLIDFLVLDALANDLESFELIAETVNQHSLTSASIEPLNFTMGEVAVALARCIRDGLVRSYLPASGSPEPLQERIVPAEFDSHWFGLTPEGLSTHEAWCA